ncbi:hypothetical protein BJV78DRAFT_81670 [Lactifluus subvellereus]|nr:hypothetical protein BJV78DRAFT_81670 [Lactifluus subvellereus]
MYLTLAADVPLTDADLISTIPRSVNPNGDSRPLSLHPHPFISTRDYPNPSAVYTRIPSCSTGKRYLLLNRRNPPGVASPCQFLLCTGTWHSPVRSRHAGTLPLPYLACFFFFVQIVQTVSTHATRHLTQSKRSPISLLEFSSSPRHSPHRLVCQSYGSSSNRTSDFGGRGAHPKPHYRCQCLQGR